MTKKQTPDVNHAARCSLWGSGDTIHACSSRVFGRAASGSRTFVFIRQHASCLRERGSCKYEEQHATRAADGYGCQVARERWASTTAKPVAAAWPTREPAITPAAL